MDTRDEAVADETQLAPRDRELEQLREAQVAHGARMETGVFAKLLRDGGGQVGRDPAVRTGGDEVKKIVGVVGHGFAD